MRSTKAKVVVFILTVLALVGLFFLSINMGSIKVTFMQLLRGLFVDFDPDVAAIYDLRFPRIIIAMIGGAGVAVSGCLFQSVLRNPVADPSLIGVSSGAVFVSTLIASFLPGLFFFTPIFAVIGGLISFAIVYSLSWKGGLTPVRVILTGIAVNAVFIGLTEGISAMSGGGMAGGSAEATFSMVTWSDVNVLFWYTAAGLLLALVLSKKCNLLALEDKTVRSLGININMVRIVVSFVAVLLASIASAVIGVITFLGLIVPHIARLLIGTDHRILVPYSIILGAFTLLLADTAGRMIAYPYEIGASIIMAIVGGPIFIWLLRGSKEYYG